MSNYNAYDIERLPQQQNECCWHACLWNRPWWMTRSWPMLLMVIANPQKNKPASRPGWAERKIGRKETKERCSHQRFLRQWMSIAAGLIILLSASVVLYRMFHQQEIKNTTPLLNPCKKDTAVTVQKQTTVDSNTVAVNENVKVTVTPSAPSPSPQYLL